MYTIEAAHNLVAVATGVGAATAGVQAAWNSSQGKREVERHQLFFLYKLGSLLQDGSPSALAGVPEKR